MEPFLNKSPDDNSFNWQEWHIQAYIVREARRMGYIIHGDANGASKTPKGIAQAKATGMLTGWPDLTIPLPGYILWVELKLTDGKLSREQADLHHILSGMGHVVHVVYASTPEDGWIKTRGLINECIRVQARRG